MADEDGGQKWWWVGDATQDMRNDVEGDERGGLQPHAGREAEVVRLERCLG